MPRAISLSQKINASSCFSCLLLSQGNTSKGSFIKRLRMLYDFEAGNEVIQNAVRAAVSMMETPLFEKMLDLALKGLSYSLSKSEFMAILASAACE